jgi:hypothetical protein
MIEDLNTKKRNFGVTLYFLQAKTSAHFKDSEIANFCDTVIDFLKETPDYDLTPKTAEYHSMYMEILKQLSYLKTFNCKLFYCSTGIWDGQMTCATTIKNKKKLLVGTGNFKSDQGDTVDIITVDNEKLRKLFDKANQPLNTEFTFAQKIPLEGIDGVKEAYIGILPFKEFKKVIIDEETGKLKPLFGDNVRDFLGVEEEVNAKINKTLQDRQFDLFQLLNNGITIIAEDNKGRLNKFILTNSQVVNGCQTSNVLFLNKDTDDIDDLSIPVKLIITDNADIRDSIIVSTNNQAEIREEQLLALTSFQKNLEQFYKSMPDGIHYERRKAQYSNELNIKKSAIVDIREQIKSYVAMFLEEPHAVSGYFGKVYRDRSSIIFVKNHTHDPYYLSAFAHYKFKQLLAAKKLERRFNKARYHLLMLFRKISEPSRKPDPSNKDMKGYCEDILKIIRDEKNCLKNFLLATKIIDNSEIDFDDQKEIYKKSTTNTLLEKFDKKYK